MGAWLLLLSEIKKDSELSCSMRQSEKLNESSKYLTNNIMKILEEVLDAEQKDITNVQIMKKGMTNSSFSFECCGKKYIVRAPGKGTSEIINRDNEFCAYEAIKGKQICVQPIYINPDDGLMVTEFKKNSRCADPKNIDDVCRCMKLLHYFHDLNIKVSNEFNIFNQINLYEKLRNSNSIYPDYEITKRNISSLKKFIESTIEKKVLTHIDAVPDNFLFYDDENGKEVIKLIDWEYAGMQDPHVDIAMFSIYALYDKKQIDKLIDIYFQKKCPLKIRIKIYCYVAACGLLWSNWCEYKESFGEIFGEYALGQYEYAKDYYEIAQKMIGELK